MQKFDSAADAYKRLAELTEAYDTGQVRLQELRVLTRAVRALVPTYATEANIDEPMGQALAHTAIAAGVERNRLYQEGSRLADEMNRINGLIQNGTYNE